MTEPEFIISDFDNDPMADAITTELNDLEELTDVSID